LQPSADRLGRALEANDGDASAGDRVAVSGELLASLHGPSKHEATRAVAPEVGRHGREVGAREPLAPRVVGGMREALIERVDVDQPVRHAGALELEGHLVRDGRLPDAERPGHDDDVHRVFHER
jgi:hypothetical protein